MKLKKISEINMDLFEGFNISSKWVDIVGEKIAKHSSPRRIKNEVLTIFVLSPAWAHHINALRHDIMRNVKEIMDIKLKKIVLINSTSSKSSSRDLKFYNEEVLELKKDNINVGEFSDIKDMSLRNKIASLARISSQRNILYQKDMEEL